MKKIILTAAAAIAVSATAFAGGLLTNTNQNAVFLRNPARNATISIDGVYHNPAGVAFLEKGFHLSVSWQLAAQKRQITSTAPFYALNTNTPGVSTKDFEGNAFAPVIPSVQAAYIFNDKWSVSAQFTIAGGGGKSEFDNGLPMFEKLVYSTIATGVATHPMLPQGSSVASYTLNQNLIGKQYLYALQIGGTYKLNSNVSVFAGVRGVLANCGYEGAITGISADVKLPAAAGGTVIPNAVQSPDFVLNCNQKGYGIQPIIGVDVNLGKLNLAAKYEFRGVINLKNEATNSANVDQMFAAYADGARVRSDIPALATVGAEYSFLKNFRAMAGFNYYFDKDAKGSATDVKDNTWETTLGLEWDVNKKWTVSLGAQRTQYSFDEDMQDTNFNISSTALCLGATYRINDMIKLNAGYMHSFYGNTDINRGNGIVDSYTRKNDVVGVSVDFKF